jgi:PAS domain S-box-containing protein
MKTKILIVEHDSNDMELIQQELKKGDVNYVTETVQTETEYKKAIHTFQPDIILSNYTFHSFDGLTALKIREKLVPETPFIFISESIDKENADALIKNGVTGFVLKERLFTLIDKMNQALHEAELTKLKELLKQSEEKRTKDFFQNESKYHSLIESSMDAILLTVKDGQILSANAAACEIFKMTHDEICAAGRFDIVDSTDPRLQPLLEERHRNGRAKGEITFKRKDGSRFPGEITSVVFIDAYGKEKTSMVIRDITDRKQAEDKQIATSNALQQALNDLNNILDSSLDVICSFDEKGRFVHVNSASEQIWGYKPQELMGKKYMDFIFHEDAENTIKADIDIRNGEPVTMFENRYIHKNGSIIPMLWSAKWDDGYKLSYCIARDATDKKNLEKAFEIERQRFIDLYLQAPSCMGILKGPNHVFEMANPLYLKLIDKTDIIGKTVKEVLPELEAQGIFEFLDTVYQTGETFSANEMLVKFDFHGNGKLVDTYLNFIYQAHRNIDGAVDGILFFAIDVTEQVLSRKKIEESKKSYRELIENLPVATYSCDADGRIMIYNKAAAALWGREPEIGKDLWFGSWKVYGLDGNPIPLKSCPMALVLKEGKALIGEEIIIERSNGDKVNVLPYPVPIFDSSGRISGAINMLMDITKIKNAELALKESEKKYRQIVETAQEGMWLIDETNKTTFVNTKMGEILEYTREEMMDKEIYSFMSEKGKKIVDKLLLHREEKYSRQSRFKFISKNGKEIWANVAANPIFDETGIYKGSLAMVTDITDRKRAEEKLEQQNLELIKTNSELDRFVYSVSHDLRSPLTSVLGLISFIEEESLETDTLEHVKMIRNSINRLDEFIKNILSYSRNKRTGLEVKKIPLQKTILDIVDSLHSMEEAKGIHFEIDIQEKMPFYSDSLRFNTILENLISNAVKYHKKNQTDSYIKIIGKSNNKKLQLSIVDNGIGIDSAHHNKIFDMFFRLSGKTEGSGIGLYIVKETVQKLEGSIQVESELGTGTTFIITLKNLKP